MSSRVAERDARAELRDDGLGDTGGEAGASVPAGRAGACPPRLLFLHSRLDIAGGSERMLARVARVVRCRAAVDLAVVWASEIGTPSADLAVFDALLAIGAPRPFGLRSLAAQFAAQRRLHRWATARAPRAIVAFDLPAALRAALLARRLRVPAVWMCQESTTAIAPAVRSRRAARYALLALLRGRLARVVCINGDAPGRLIEMGFDPARVLLIRNGVAVDHLAARRLDAEERRAWRRAHAIPDADLVAVCAARIEPWKDQAALLGAVCEAARAGVRVTLVCVGAINPGADGYARALRCQAAEQGIDAQVVWAGFQADVAAWLGMADVAVLASRGEAGPLALAEAAAVGLPLIGSRVEGVTDVIRPGETGLLFEPGDAAGCGQALVTLARDGTLRERLGRNAGADARHRFDGAASDANWLRLFDELLEGGHRR